MDQLTALRIFSAIVREGSFAGAARKLRLSPAAVSKNISELEAKLGVRLLNRTTRRLSLTDAGDIYAERVNRILDDLAEADQTLTDLSGEVSGRLRVSAPLTLGLLALSPAIPAFLQRHPNLSLDLDLDDRKVDVVRDGFDLVLRGSPAMENSGLIARKIVTLRYVVCAAPNYLDRLPPIGQPEDLAGQDLVQFSIAATRGTLVFERAGRKVEVAMNNRYAVSSSLAIRDALRAGFGFGRIPEALVRADLSSGDLVEVVPDWSAGELDLFALYPSRRHVQPKVASFIQLMAEAFKPLSARRAVPGG